MDRVVVFAFISIDHPGQLLVPQESGSGRNSSFLQYHRNLAVVMFITNFAGFCLIGILRLAIPTWMTEFLSERLFAQK